MGKKSRDKGTKKERRRAGAPAGGRAAAEQPGAPGPITALAPSHAAPEVTAHESSTAPHRARHAAVGATELAARLASLSTVLQRQLARADKGDGLTRARLSALALLVLGGPRTLGQLAAAERVRPPTMTRLVHAMESEGLVARERNPSDGRSVIIRATPSGEARLEQGRSRQIAPLAEAIAQLESNERRQLEDASDLLGLVLREASRYDVGIAE